MNVFTLELDEMGHEASFLINQIFLLNNELKVGMHTWSWNIILKS